MMAKFQQGATP